MQELLVAEAGPNISNVNARISSRGDGSSNLVQLKLASSGLATLLYVALVKMEVLGFAITLN